MIIIKHRINTLDQLIRLEPGLGAEVDLRSRDRQIILAHDPFVPGEPFELYLEEWAKKARGTLILNTKEDGLEKEILFLLQKWNVQDFFFLDLTMPTSIRLMRNIKLRKIAVRVSEFEPLEGLTAFEGKVDWAWLDCFTGVPASAELVKALARKFKICLVSPELQGYPLEEISRFQPLTPSLSAVCTKQPELWASE